MGEADLTGRRILVVEDEYFLAHDLSEALAAVGKLRFSGSGKRVAQDIVPEIAQRLSFMGKVGLDYLSLDRSARTLSGGESQRIRLAAQLGSNLRGVLYVLDEPTIGLHPRDNDALLDTHNGGWTMYIGIGLGTLILIIILILLLA